MSRMPRSEQQVLGILIVVVVLLGAGKRLWPDLVPLSALTVPVMVAGWRLGRRSVLALSAVVAVVLVVDLLASPFARSYLAAGVVVAASAIAYRYATLRERWGMSATVGVPLLLEVRDRVRALGEPPPLPPDWVMARALRSADGSAMRGDFTLVHPSGTSLAVMVVDVSGHGIDVGPRAVQLAGAFGGLMGEVQPSRLMGACNDYLVRQGWERHYATAAHVVIDLATGEATVRAAGHPAPKVRRRDSSWTAVPAHGPLFGLVPEVEYGGVRVQMAAGDTLVVVSDGALDERSDDAWAGVVRAVDLWTDSGQPGGTQEVPKEAYLSSDDQTIVAIHRKSGR